MTAPVLAVVSSALPGTDTRLRTPAEVAREWGCSRGFLTVLVARGELRAVRLGRLLRFHPDDLAAYLEQQRTGGRL